MNKVQQRVAFLLFKVVAAARWMLAMARFHHWGAKHPPRFWVRPSMMQDEMSAIIKRQYTHNLISVEDLHSSEYANEVSARPRSNGKATPRFGLQQGEHVSTPHRRSEPVPSRPRRKTDSGKDLRRQHSFSSRLHAHRRLRHAQNTPWEAGDTSGSASNSSRPGSASNSNTVSGGRGIYISGPVVRSSPRTDRRPRYASM
eukprot:FR743966.1.p1 GENE.FR743966.1~~FR743966.1.p1  ORF type:complete len:218 (+),score=2.81 FR743966.1:57-656(+)